MTTAQSVSTPSTFIHMWKPSAQQASQALGIPWQWILAQWGMETAWGTQHPVVGVNNPGNLKKLPGQSGNVFANFKNAEQFVQEYIRTMKSTFPSLSLQNPPTDVQGIAPSGLSMSNPLRHFLTLEQFVKGQTYSTGKASPANSTNYLTMIKNGLNVLGQYGIQSPGIASTVSGAQQHLTGKGLQIPNPVGNIWGSVTKWIRGNIGRYALGFGLGGFLIILGVVFLVGGEKNATISNAIQRVSRPGTQEKEPQEAQEKEGETG